mgnify:CR=1 FL=1
MKEGSYLCSRFHSGYSVEGYIYERDIRLKKGLVLTDDGQALIRTPPRPGLWINENFLRMIDGEQFRKGPWPGEMPSEPLPWYPFCVDGKWGVGDADSGDVVVEPQWAFCDCFIENCARFSASGDFSDLSWECYNGAFGMYDDGLDMFLPPIYQHLSSMQDGVVLAKKDDLWGAFLWTARPEIPFEWDHMTFAQGTIVAMKNTGSGPRYTLFHEKPNYSTLEAYMDGLTSVTVPEGEPWDGYHFMARLIERDGRWGVLCCPNSDIIAAPTLSREEAEKVFWEIENREFDNDDEGEE